MGTSLTQNSLVPVRMTAFIIFSCETFGLRSPLVSSIANLRNLYERYLSARVCVILQKTNIIMQHQAKNVSKSQVIDHKKDHHADPQFRSQVVPPPPIVQASQKSKSDDILSQQLRERLAYVRKCVLSELDEFGQRLSNLLSNYNLIKFASKTGQDIQGYIDGSESQQTLITKMKQAGLSEHGFIEAIQNCKEQLQASRHQKSFINFQLICPTGLTLIRRYDDLINKYFPIININGSKQPQEESRPSVFQLKSTKFSEEEYRGIESLLQSANRKLKSVTLIFRASEHQFRSKAFKEECSKMEKTMVVVKSVKGRVFGGYTPCKWLDTKETEYIADTHRQSFLFSLDQKLVFPVRQNQTDYAISTYGSWGPIFGSPYGPDLSLADQCHLNEHSCSSLGSHYEIPITVKQFSNEAFCLLAGSKKFKVVQYQVFQVQFE